MNVIRALSNGLKNLFGGKEDVSSTHDPILDSIKLAKLRADISMERVERKRAYPIGNMVSAASRNENRRNARGRNTRVPQGNNYNAVHLASAAGGEGDPLP